MSDQILVTRSSMPPLDEYVAEIAGVFESHWLTNMGPKHQELESKLSEFLKVPHVSLFTNGHNAIECALEVLDLKGEVITTPFTFASTTNAIVRKGLKPVFCDIRSDDLTIDPEKIEELITEDTCAIMPVHVYGNLCDVDAIKDIADKHGLKVIYDAAHAFGVEKNGISAACFGDISAFSFHATKVFNTIEGGGLTYEDEHYREKIIALRNFGMQDAETIEKAGGNSKMNEFCACMGLCNLRRLDEEIEKRRRVFERYQDNLAPLYEKGVYLPGIGQNIKRNYAYFPVFFDSKISGCTRDDVIDALAKECISARKYFYPITSKFFCMEQFKPNSTPIAEAFSNGILTLPLYSDLPIEDVDRISKIVKETIG